TRGEGAHGVRRAPGVAGDDLDVLEPGAELVGDDLRERRLVTLPLGGQAGGDLHLAAGLDGDVTALVGTDTGALDVAGDADADLATLGPGLVAEPLEVLPADERLRLRHELGVVARVVDQRATVLEAHLAVGIGELVGLDEVALAHQR